MLICLIRWQYSCNIDTGKIVHKTDNGPLLCKTDDGDDFYWTSLEDAWKTLQHSPDII
jgi:hypothetical protein